MMRTMIFGLLGSVLLVLSTVQASAVGLLRDPDIERGLSELAKPILTAAGLSPSSVRILVVDDPNLNAFVIDHRHIFIHYGLILKTQNAAQLQAVIAHETAHIANGHIGRRINALKNARVAQVFGTAIAVAAAAGGQGKLATGIAAGTAGSARGVLMGHSRAEESSADQSAFAYLRRAQVSPNGMVDMFNIFRGQEALATGRQDPWARSHPLTRDRIRAAQAAATGATQYETPNSTEFWFQRVKGKLSAFKRAPRWTLTRATGDSDIDLMRQAIAHHRNSSSDKAQRAMATLIARRPRDPYFRELQAQILLESRSINAATNAYQAAVNLAPSNALILGGLAKSLLAQNTSASNRAALRHLEKARARDSRDIRILRDLGTAYARAGQQGKAILSAAEAAALRGDTETAGIQAKRASGLLPRGSSAWQRAQDLIPKGG